MEYEEILHNLYVNKKLNEAGLNEFIKIILNELYRVKSKVQELEFKLRGKPK